MKNTKSYENFPVWIPFIAILISVIGYVIGAIILSGYGIIFSILYLFYCFGAMGILAEKVCNLWILLDIAHIYPY